MQIEYTRYLNKKFQQYRKEWSFCLMFGELCEGDQIKQENQIELLLIIKLTANHHMYSMPNNQHKRSISQNHNYRYINSALTDTDNNDSLSNKLETQQHQEILKERARRFVARMRKQREYVGGKHVLKKQAEERRRQEEQKLMRSVMHEKEEIQKSIKMTVALQKILINECKKEKKLIKQLSQQLKTSNLESSDQESKSRYEGQRRSIDKQIGSAKRFKTFESERGLQMQQSSKMSILPPIAVANQPRQIENNVFKYYKPLTKPKQDRQIYLNKLDQMKLKSIDSKMRKLSKLQSEILYQQK